MYDELGHIEAIYQFYSRMSDKFPILICYGNICGIIYYYAEIPIQGEITITYCEDYKGTNVIATISYYRIDENNWVIKNN